MKEITRKILFAFIISPLLLVLVMHANQIMREWRTIPSYFKNNAYALLSGDKLVKMNEVRWNSFGGKSKISGLIYNKGYVVIDDFFSLLTYYSPRFYFQAGDGTLFSPKNTEPVAIPAFFFWLFGIVGLVKKKSMFLIYAALLFGVFAFLVGRDNFAFLFPVAISYILIAYQGIVSIKSKNLRTLSFVSVVIYGLFLYGRMFWVK